MNMNVITKQFRKGNLWMVRAEFWEFVNWLGKMGVVWVDVVFAAMDLNDLWDAFDDDFMIYNCSSSTRIPSSFFQKYSVPLNGTGKRPLRIVQKDYCSISYIDILRGTRSIRNVRNFKCTEKKKNVGPVLSSCTFCSHRVCIRIITPNV